MSFVHSLYFSYRISAVQQTKLTEQRNNPQAKNSASGRIGGGVFFQRKRRKKSHRMVRLKRVFKELKKCHFSGWFGQSVSLNSTDLQEKSE